MRRSTQITATDLFCGAGGSSTGLKSAGVEVYMAANHWALAIETHNTNHPQTDHFCADVSQVHPGKFPSTTILWASPECTNHSIAKGKKRTVNRGQLSLGEDYAPLATEAEDRSRATMWDVVRFSEHHRYDLVVVENVVDIWDWSLLPAWFAAMDALGYASKPLFLNSMFFWPTPQSRDRVYVVFWRKGNRAPDLDFHPPSWCWECSGEVAGVQAWKKPGAPHGRYRAQYIYVCPKCRRQVAPFVYPAASAIDWGLRGERIGDRKKALADATMARIQAGIDRYWTTPGVLDTSYDGARPPRDVTTSPLFTQTGRQTQALYIPLIAHLRGTHASAIAGSTRSAGEPIGTLTGGGIHHGVVESPDALYVKNYGPAAKAGPMTHPVSDPLGTVTAQDHHALLSPPLIYVGRAANRSRPVDEPIPTLTTGGNMGLIVDQPMPTRTAVETDGLVRPPSFIHSYYSGGGQVHDITAPLPTQSATDRHALVGSAPAIEDCAFRMLEPHEIGRAMAFLDDYTVLGNKRERVRQLGQAVTPPVPAWIASRLMESLR